MNPNLQSGSSSGHDEEVHAGSSNHESCTAWEE